MARIKYGRLKSYLAFFMVVSVDGVKISGTSHRGWLEGSTVELFVIRSYIDLTKSGALNYLRAIEGCDCQPSEK
jgi:hypothetical protein